MNDSSGERSAAIILAGGQGRRMRSATAKQYLLLDGKPVLWYSLKTFQQSAVDDIVLAVGRGEEEYVRREIVEKYGFTKVRAIVEGGRERYHSVWNGLCALKDSVFTPQKTPLRHVLIQDGARPFVTEEMIGAALDCVRETGACIVGIPAKDTVKIIDEYKDIADTPDRSLVWLAQTPQVFEWNLIYDVYEKLIQEEASLLAGGVRITDDASVVELFSGRKVRMVQGSYENIKITTPDDLVIAEAFLQKKKQT